MRSLVIVPLLVAGCLTGEIVPPKALKKAEKIWTERCANCHGNNGRGDGPGAATLDVKPRDFHDRTWQLQVSDEQITRIIVDGGKGVGKSEQMAANPDLASQPDVLRGLLMRVRAFGP